MQGFSFWRSEEMMSWKYCRNTVMAIFLILTQECLSPRLLFALSCRYRRDLFAKWEMFHVQSSSSCDLHVIPFFSCLCVCLCVTLLTLILRCHHEGDTLTDDTLFLCVYPSLFFLLWLLVCDASRKRKYMSLIYPYYIPLVSTRTVQWRRVSGEWD